jgi:hypothetical protein
MFFKRNIVGKSPTIFFIKNIKQHSKAKMIEKGEGVWREEQSPRV